MKTRFGFIICCVVLNVFWSSAFARQENNLADNPKRLHEASEKQGSPLLYPLKFYRDYISGSDGDRCPMYPTCSQYCMDAVKKHGSLTGWIMCSDRLMRCGRDETKLSAPVWINGEKRNYDPVSNNDFWRQ
ncbi:MAG: membrane protein insertion efficiency factor YidD [Deltaproteobacteria bacterium]|jgi:putative membrane protein insertion efficiency factor|nr:membrane protein insertion efficiency factor YidD [Deltaproteobacteria bacterium]MDX2497996.1 membrane protein insertion efficiency factor YidD [Desulfobacterales bacterium]